MRLASRFGSAGGILLAAALLLGGCGKPEIRGEPDRIIALAPSITETLFELGLGDQVVGVGDYSTWPPEAASKPRLGGLFDARLETITALAPDLAFLLPSEEELRIQMERLGIDVITVKSDTMADIENTVRVIGDRCDAEDAAERFLMKWERGLVPRRVGGAPKVVLTMGRMPRVLNEILVAGPRTYLHELLVRVGAFNAFADAPVQYPQVGLEEILGRRPDAIIELQPSRASIAAMRSDWLTFPGTEKLLRSECVQVIIGDHVLVPGPRLPRLYDELRRALVDCVGSE